MKRIRAAAGIGVVLAALIAGAATPAHAASDSAYAASDSAHAAPDFAVQARAAGLTRAEVESVQQRVEGYLARVGGTQVAVNKISLDGKGEILLALPGERRAREVGAAGGIGVTGLCPEGNFCAFSQQGWNGDLLKYYYCAYRLTMPFAGFGSYVNNQTQGATAHFYDSNGVYMYDSLVPAYAVYTFNWTPVYSIKPCGSI